jgi:hypothetical protein
MLDAVGSSRLISNTLQTRRTLQASGADESAPYQSDPVAAHFQRQASSIHSAADLLADRTSLSLMQRALGFKLDASAARASQMDLIRSMINFHDFQIPSKIQRFIELYTSQGGSGALVGGPALHAVLPPQASSPVSDAVLETLQSLRPG